MRLADLSVVIITHNEEYNIRTCLESVRFAGEIVVVDSYSTDRTEDIAREYTDKVYQREFDNFSSQRNFSLEKATKKWVLVVDSDEVVSNLLRSEISLIVTNREPECAYAIRRNNIFIGKKMRFSGMRNDTVVRLFPNHIRYCNRVHETPDLKGLPLKKMSNWLDHFTYRSYGVMMAKIDHYSTLKAQEMYENGYNPTLLKMVFKPAHRFFKHYIAQGGIFEGKRGFIIAYTRALEVFERITKTWRLKEGEKL